MAEPDPQANEAPQPLVGFLTNEQWDELLARVDALVQRMDSLPPGKVKDQVFDLLNGIDAIHREALRRLVRLFKPGGLEQICTDPAIRTLLELYDLLPATAEKSKGAFPIPVRVVRTTPPAPVRYPHWVPVANSVEELAPGAVREVTADDVPMLLARRGREIFAVAARCAVDGAAMQGATLNGLTLVCPRHAGCYYDVRQGTHLGGSERLACYPVRVDETGRVLVGLDMDFHPNLPSM